MKWFTNSILTTALLTLAAVTNLKAQNITVTVAGTGIAGYTGDGGPGNHANIKGPTDLCMDASQNIYFVDAGNNRIRKVTAATGIITTIAGGGSSAADGVSATSASMTGLTKMCVDASGNIYLSTANKIRKVSAATGIITTVAGTGTAGSIGDGGAAVSAQLNAPSGVCVDAAGNIYIADVNNNRIRKVNAATGLISTIAGTGVSGTSGDGSPATAATLSQENSICVDASGNVFCANSDAIRKIAAGTGIITTVCSPGEVNGISSDGSGNIYYVQDSCGCIKYNLATGLSTLIANNGTDGYNGDGGNSTIMELNHPCGVCVDPAGNIYVADRDNNRIRKAALLTSTPTFIYGTPQLITPCPGYSAPLSSPLAVDDLSTVATETWTVVTPPTIGTLAGFPATALSGGANGLAMPSLATYTPAAGYTTGTDSFQVQVSNGTSSTVVKIYVSIHTASPGSISGPSAVCASSAVSLSSTVPGTWSVTNANATIDIDGSLHGVTVGTDTVIYTFLESCPPVVTQVVTIYPLPATAPISGNDTVCIGATIPLTDPIAGGVWSSDFTYDLTVGSSSGIVTGVSYDYGPDPIDYTVTNAFGCSASVEKDIQVAAAVEPIGGPATVCIGASISLNDEIDGGTWSVSNAHATIAGSGASALLTGLVVGIDTVMYTNTNLCGTTTVKKIITVNPLVTPGTVSGPSSVCVGGEITLTPSIPGGTWTDANGDVFADGWVDGETAGVDTVFYTSACASSPVATVITVNPLPGGTIVGSAFVCLGSTITLTDVTPGGTWSASNSFATVSGTGPASAAVTGITYGTDIISYTSTNVCGTGTVVKSIAVDTAVSSSGTVSGSTSVCTGATISLAHSAAGGMWSVTNPNASATSATSGIITGITAGVDTIVYTVACALTSATTVVTVHPSPATGIITGADTVCTGATITLSDAVTGGVWSSANPLKVSVSSAGIATGLAYGTGAIKYTTSNAWCSAYASKTLDINAPVAAISGASIVCLASPISLSETISGGAWSTTNGTAVVAGTGPGSATLTGIATGIDTVVYANTNTCGIASATLVVSVNPSVAAGAISGASSVCVGPATSHYTDVTAGGAWSTSNTICAHIGPAGNLTAVTPGTDTVIYTVSNGCHTAVATYVVTIGTSGGAITGPGGVCAGTSIVLGDAATGGTWSVSNSNAAVSGSGVVTGLLPGLDTVSYSISNSCGLGAATAVVAISVSPVAGTIVSAADVCASATITATDIAPGGVWSEVTGLSGISASGMITGISAGVDTIKYTVTNFCGMAMASETITVNPLPDAGTIAGAAHLCAGTTTTASDAASSGLWTTTTGNATVSPVGVITGVTAGSDMISYTVTNTCGPVSATLTITIDALPDAGTIISAAHVCAGATVTASDAVSSGLWSAATDIATISATGIITGVTAGSDMISYTVTNTCGTASTAQAITIDPLPYAGTITSVATTLCKGATTGVTDDATGGAWSAINGNASVSAEGIVTGIAPGTDSIVYTVVNTCGAATTASFIEVRDCIDNIPVVNIPSIRVFPNPATSVISIEWSNWANSNTPVTITDVLGKDLYKTELANSGNGSMQISITDLPPGVYFVKIEGYSAQKLVKD